MTRTHISIVGVGYMGRGHAERYQQDAAAEIAVLAAGYVERTWSRPLWNRREHRGRAAK